MVKTRTVSTNVKMQAAFNNTMSRFGKTLTHRAYTTTRDENGRVTARSETDASFTGAIIDNPRVIRHYLPQASIEVGDAMVFVSRTDTQGPLISMEDLVINGAGAGNYSSYEVLQRYEEPDPAGQIVFYAFKVHLRYEVTL